MQKVVAAATNSFDFSSRLYDPEKSKEENFCENRNYILIKINEHSLRIEDPSRFFKPGVKYLTKADHVFENENSLETVFVDTHENSAHGVILKNFRKYNPKFFSCDERVFFEALLVKSKSLDGVFYWSMQQARSELGIKRDRRKAIIKRFTKLGIIETTTIPIPNEPLKSITQFTVNIDKVIELIPEIYDKKIGDLTEIESDLIGRYT